MKLPRNAFAIDTVHPRPVDDIKSNRGQGNCEGLWQAQDREHAGFAGLKLI